MEQKEALRHISDGHTIWTPETADEICDALGVSRVKATLYHSDPPGTLKGLSMKVENSLGVDGRQLSQHVVSELGLEVRSFIGRGFQAQANAQAVANHFKDK